ncbi:glycosylphosphatidylinositol anchor biosynthesis [Puccinia graminis f. sp. tritici]|uniref:Glycosylphosphatidylinositol anchor biosynthesis n=1 Tax=Puccinia graminis f. sp. tritici TaxID=56615 RepID=A0A5B0R077_PUCGR|nr:glycosylphosphatidylinositol anchor biosynthesis [Puccinia graminis f. sp. tritici]
MVSLLSTSWTWRRCLSMAVIPLAILMQANRSNAVDHSNNWAVLVCTSRFWFNYRHIANTLGMYRSVKRLGIPDSNIILMLADDMACNPRNMFPGTVYSNSDRKLDLYGDGIEVDYRGEEVSVENFIRLLTGRVAEGTPRSKRLMTDERSNILVYMTGHGGDEFLKFQDAEEISAFDLADAFQTMWAKKRYNELLFMIDTCQANTMTSKLYSPNIVATGSSAKGENSYSHHADSDIGVAVVDRYSHFVLSHLEAMNKTSSSTLQDFVNAYSFDIFHSTPAARSDLLGRSMSQVLMTDFFGGVSSVELAPLPADRPETPEPIKPEAVWKLTASRWKSVTQHVEESLTRSKPLVENYWRQLSTTLLLTLTFSAHLWAANTN